MRKFILPVGLGLIIVLVLVGAFLFGNWGGEDGDRVGGGAPKDDNYDVIVIGGEPEGVAAAVSAARNGAKTLLVEHREDLGGLFTYGMLNFLDIPQGPDKESVSKGIFEEWHRMVGGKSSFGILEAKDAFRELVDNEENLELLTETRLLDVVKDGNQLVGVRLENESGEFGVSGASFIDATQDADLAVMAGVPHFVGGEDIGLEGKKMSVTLVIHLKNLDWAKIRETAETEKFGWGFVTDVAAWGFPDLLREYTPVVENTRLRGLNLAKVGDEYFINALQIFGVDGLSEESKQEGIERGKRETENIVAFLREKFPGFEDAEIISFPPELYVRETRHIWAEYQLPMSDVWTNADHWDSVALGAYPVDIQAQTPQDYGHIVADPVQYAIPLRSLVPLEVDGLLVVGRSSGYSSIAAGSARVVPTGMAAGEAAGVAAALSVREDLLFRNMSADESLITAVRERLSEQGAYVEHFELDYPYMGEWFDKSVQLLLNYGLIFGGYDNDLKVDEDTELHRFISVLNNIIDRVDYGENTDLIAQRMKLLTSEMEQLDNQTITRDEVTDIISRIFFDRDDMTWQQLIDLGVVSNDIAAYISDDAPLTNKEIYAICAELIRWSDK